LQRDKVSADAPALVRHRSGATEAELAPLVAAEHRQFAAEFGDLEDTGSIDGLKNSLETIVMGDFFQREISQRYPKGSPGRLEVCARVCGK
jgi:hypothetical protein